ncbi:hypothetical protein K491DRAFT_291649 [Lophiostoma macrostomum CBS 122681]|uniref:Uncharacterized protein n=1 Tax=Lophiostoma macrostomum CBS 122681 TaxID=1314788 RepID=A0A6A6SL74_9PLEO|nr:hypothetical protein K491DRAFT_291649 [Lophiostoma macrostomum CBS 122681]
MLAAVSVVSVPRRCCLGCSQAAHRRRLQWWSDQGTRLDAAAGIASLHWKMRLPLVAELRYASFRLPHGTPTVASYDHSERMVCDSNESTPALREIQPASLETDRGSPASHFGNFYNDLQDLALVLFLHGASITEYLLSRSTIRRCAHWKPSSHFVPRGSYRLRTS